jgi:uncharacterized protein YndB with AHSA1/START domain
VTDTETVEVRRTITVEAPIARAFEVFATRMGTWWPQTHRMGSEPIDDLVLEPRTGGRWVEHSTDGTEVDWGEVLVWNPPTRLMLSWGISGDWKLEGPGAHSEIDVRFIAETPGRTRVELAHRGLERHTGDWVALRDTVSGDKGWGHLLSLYAGAL